VLMTYVGAAGLIGLGIVTSLLFAPGGEAMPSSMEPLSQLVQTMAPGTLGARPGVSSSSSAGIRPAALPTVVIDVRVLPSIDSTADGTAP
jgi:hypothetical protein